MKDPGRVLILGAGPSGLGAAFRFQEMGFGNFLVLEALESAGGLSGSHVDAQGFTWDIGGHVQFSHYKYYDDVLDRALGDSWLYHERESWIRMEGRFIPYPFQYNIHRLSAENCEQALKGLEIAASNGHGPAPSDFQSWIHQTFGEGIANLFLCPYNRKVWGYPLEMLGVRWMGERVAVPDLARIQRNIREDIDDVSWGPNSTFRFPKKGGTGAIWNAVAGLIEPARLQFGSTVAGIDLASRLAILTDGRRLKFETLITTIPLDRFVGTCDGLSPDVRRASRSMIHSSVHVIGVGLRGPKPPALERKCWLYFPEPNSPYYRVTIFSNYSPHNVPEGGDCWSLMAEVCESPCRPVDGDELRAWTLRAMQEDGLIAANNEVVSYWHFRAEHGYPTPFRGRDELLAEILPALEEHRVFSRGRFGAWKYEVGNQDHSFMQGVEAADRMLGAGEEITFLNPNHVNSGAFR